MFLLDYEDIRDILKEEIEPIRHRDVHPVICISIGNVNVTAILDSGSQISAISDAAYKQCLEDRSWPTLKVNKMKVKGALLGKQAEIQMQCRMTLKCQGHKWESNLMVVPMLAIELLLGMDFLSEHLAILDIGRGELVLQKDTKATIRFSNQATKAEIPKECLRLSTDNTRAFSPPMCPHKMHIENLEEVKHEVWSAIDNLVENLTDIPTEDRAELDAILKENAVVFLPKTGAIRNFVYAFAVKQHQKFAVAPYGIPLARREAVRAELKKMEDEGIIERASSTYNSPLLIVEKHDKSIRLVLDSRQINTIIEPETDRPEKLEELLQNFHGARVFTTLDLRSSFWQIVLHPDCRKYTAFLAFGTCYQFKRLPFGLSVSSPAFIRGLNTVLQGPIRKRITSYVDDLLIAEPSWAEHNLVLGEVLRAFRECGVTVNIKKSYIGTSTVKFLGHVISAEGISPDPEKLEAIAKFPTPTTKRQLRGFLGVINFYKRFLHISKLGTPRLCALTSKKAAWNWDAETDNEFRCLKEALLDAPILSHPNLEEDLCLATDSSYTGLGVMIFQRYQEAGNTVFKTIAFGSRVLNKAERNYAITELECLAIVWGFEKFRFFLYGRKTKVFTDHKALEFLMTAKLKNKRLTRWVLTLQEYDFEVVHVPGVDNVIADALSRSPVGLEEVGPQLLQEEHFSLYYMRQVAFENFVSKSLSDLAKEQDRDPVLLGIKTKVRDRTEPKLRKYYLLRKGILFFNSGGENAPWRVCIPEELINKVIWHTHLSYGHFGPRKCYLKLRELAYFKCMEKRIRRVLAVCKQCQKAKHSTVNLQVPLHPIIPTKSRQIGAADLMGPLPRTNRGYTYILVVMELTSKFVTLTPLRRATARTVSKAFCRDFLTQVGRVEKVITDNGPQFKAELWKQTLRRHRIEPVFASARHPQSNPAETVMKKLGNMCRIYCNKRHATWDVFLRDFQEVINDIPHTTTMLAPVTVLKNVVPKDLMREVVDFPPQRRRRHQEIVDLALQRIERAGLKRKAVADRKAGNRIFVAGQKVLVKSFRLSNKQKQLCHKFYSAYNGPLRIRRMVHPYAAELESIKSGKSMGIHPVCHIKQFIE